MIITPIARFDEGQNACSVRAWLGAEDASSGSALIAVGGKIILRVPSDEVQLAWLVSIGHETYGIVKHRHDVWERVAKEARDANRDIDPRPAQLGEIDRLKACHPARRLVPNWHNAE
jgi:hypothetical protein